LSSLEISCSLPSCLTQILHTPLTKWLNILQIWTDFVSWHSWRNILNRLVWYILYIIYLTNMFFLERYNTDQILPSDYQLHPVFRYNLSVILNYISSYSHSVSSKQLVTCTVKTILLVRSTIWLFRFCHLSALPPS
jgi:hypothetical protein